MEPGGPVFSAGPEETVPPPAPRRRGGWAVLAVLFAGAAVAGFLLYRRTAAGTARAGAEAGGAPPSGALIATLPVQLSPKAAVIADRFRCLCGECTDTLGACTCTRDKGSNEMKTALNQIVEEKKTIPEIEAAMAARFGPGVFVSAPASEKPASNQP